jgi:hypothetical protein
MSREALIAARTHLRAVLRAEPEIRLVGIMMIDSSDDGQSLEVKVYGPRENIPTHVIPTLFEGFPVTTTVIAPPNEDQPFHRA